MRVCYTTDIACKPDHLWKFLEEPELQKQWMKGLLDNQPTGDGPRGVGSTFRMKIQEGGKAADYDGKITAYDKPRHMAVDLTGGNFPCGMVVNVDYQMSEVNGGTRLEYVAAMTSGRPLPWWMRLMLPIGKIFMKMQLHGFMKKLKNLAEAPA